MEIIPSKKKLNHYLTSNEIEFIKKHKDLINDKNWPTLINKMGANGFDLDNIKAIFKFLKDNLPNDNGTYSVKWFLELVNLDVDNKEE